MDRGTRPARYLLPGALLVALCGTGCGAASSGPAPADAQATVAAANPGDVAVAASPMMVTAPPGKASPSASATRAVPSASPSAQSPSAMMPTGGSSARPSTRASAPATHPASSPSTRPSSTPASAPASQGGTAVAQVLALINQARAAAGHPALTQTSGLQSSASAHNQLMSGGCGLSHQCPGEAAIGDRETAAGVHWTSAGENIGDGGPVDNTASAIAKMAVGLTQSMLNEKPPDDGHRQNILSASFTHVGIAVLRDGSGTVWLTQDFSN